MFLKSPSCWDKGWWLCCGWKHILRFWLSLQGQCHALLCWELGKAPSRAEGLQKHQAQEEGPLAIPFHCTESFSQPGGAEETDRRGGGKGREWTGEIFFFRCLLKRGERGKWRELSSASWPLLLRAQAAVSVLALQVRRESLP